MAMIPMARKRTETLRSLITLAKCTKTGKRSIPRRTWMVQGLGANVTQIAPLAHSGDARYRERKLDSGCYLATIVRCGGLGPPSTSYNLLYDNDMVLPTTAPNNALLVSTTNKEITSM
eukprot:TRINITY_DN53889_c0_g1_i1.p1 TRINITY_DN53889_c0_g1~~TRINITY_DN53889_c0_g1_i1.p1  ORF type:complete len:118 (-),score=0.78 TRINITY_DN53889_c0_g1_i1:24-377(-)